MMRISKKHLELISNLSKIENLQVDFDEKQRKIDHILEIISKRIIELSKREESLKKNEIAVEEKANQKISELNQIQKGIETIISEKSISFPWLCEAISDYLYFRDEKIVEFLKVKKRPAILTSEKIKEIALEKKILTKQLLITKYRIDYYEKLFPYLTEFVDDKIDDLLIQVLIEHEKVENEDDPVKIYITSGEYNNLSVSERNQRALDRYFTSRKTPYQIGRDYERYVGYLYESQDYAVSYFGIAEGLEDLGRDLICKKNNIVKIVQCKCWASHKTIHEKHINQLYGTTVKYYIDHNAVNSKDCDLSRFPELIKKGEITPVFYTSTKLSDTAKRFAEALGVIVNEQIQLKSYPVIKCHINKQTGEKIYHLPFDQMYDKTILEKKYGEFYASTVAEAEKHGFRRAWRWMGE